MIKLAHTGCSRWGKWIRSIDGSAGSGLTMRYHSRAPGDEVPDAEYDDPVGELVDTIIAAMPIEMAMAESALKKKYIEERSNYEIRQYLRVGESRFYEIIKEGQVWVCSYLTALYKSTPIDREIKRFYEENS